MLRQRLGAFRQQSGRLLVDHYSADNATVITNEFPKRSTTQDLPERYRKYLTEKTLEPSYARRPCPTKVAIVGAGMSGLYSALLLKKTGNRCENF